MKLLRQFLHLRRPGVLVSLARRDAARPPIKVTVPQPLPPAGPAASMPPRQGPKASGHLSALSSR
jgi:hypothetical protein